ncbi:MAG: type IV pilus twitching motility protein PilT [Candidatus Omnitrophota bacterium]
MQIQDIFKAAITSNASDVHISPGLPPMFRIAGTLTPSQFPQVTSKDSEELAYSMITAEQKTTFETKWELDCSYALSGLSRFRVNLFLEKDGIGIAARLIPTKIPTPEELDLAPALLKFTQLRNGLVLVTGPTGSGKSTTLAALINSINLERSCHIVTVEDPIEFTYKHEKSIIHQRELNAHTHSFVEALKHLLRQDPNVVLVGEMRDLETIAAAITIAETGHLVFATLHTLDSAQTVDRIIDVFPPYQQQQIRTMLAGALKGVVCQQLLPCKDGKSRVAAREVMIVNPAIACLIREGKTHQIYNVIQTARQSGMLTMDQSVLNLLKEGLISEEVAAASMNDASSLKGGGQSW